MQLGATPSVLWAMNQTRGFLGGIVQPMTKDVFESLWSPYFFNFESSKWICTECRDDEGHQATLRIFYDMERTTMAVPPEPQPPQQQPSSQVSPGSFIPPLAFERLSFANVSSTLYASVQGQGNLNFDGGPDIGPSSEFFPSSVLNPQLSVQMFSQLNESGSRRQRPIPF